MAVLGAVVALGVALLATAAPATAASCSGYGCDGANPYGAGCFTGSTVVADDPLYDPSGYYTYGRVRLHYSKACRTVWASIYDATATYSGQAYSDIHRNSDGTEIYCFVPVNGSSCYTGMLYDGGVTSHAYGSQRAYDPFYNATETFSYRTVNY
jgi:hypothetical protein